MQSVDEWPWSWVRLLGHVRKVKSVYERVALDPDPDTAVPPRWMFWEDDSLDEWFDGRRETLSKLTREVGDDKHVNLRR